MILRFTEDREAGGQDGGGGHPILRHSVHPVKVDEKYNFYDSVSGPHGEVCHEGNPRQKIK